MPRRIQRKRTAGWKMPQGAVYVGRPSKWGNPFRKGEEISRDSPLFAYAGGFQTPVETFDGLRSIRILLIDRVIEAYTRWLCETPALMLSLDELAGKDLACWCKLDQPCHADVLLGLANPEGRIDHAIEGNTL